MPRNRSPFEQFLDDVADRASQGLDDFFEDTSRLLRTVAKQQLQAQHHQPHSTATRNARRPQPAQPATLAREPKSYYATLKVSRDAPPEVIQAAYKALARKHHPDTGGDSDSMREINKAFSVLKDPAKRKAYDRTL